MTAMNGVDSLWGNRVRKRHKGERRMCAQLLKHVSWVLFFPQGMISLQCPEQHRSDGELLTRLNVVL